LIVAGIAWAFYNFLTKKVVQPLSFDFAPVLPDAVWYALYAAASLFERVQWQAPTLMTFSMMLFLGVFLLGHRVFTV
jgi:hypothetical protein